MSIPNGSDPASRLAEKSLRIKRRILKAVFAAGKGHLGGALSIVEILTAIYFSANFKLVRANEREKSQDHFLLSKGHAAVALYATLVEAGVLQGSELLRMNKGFLLAEHPSPNIPGVEFLSGSLGHGLSLGAGIALAERMDGSDARVVVLLGDGECYEGSVWEAAQFAAHHKLGKLLAIVDRNGLITHGKTEDINAFGDLEARWKSFGWQVVELDGHNLDQLCEAFAELRDARDVPTVILASTVKGNGVRSIQNTPESHHGSLSQAELEIALSDLDDSYA